MAFSDIPDNLEKDPSSEWSEGYNGLLGKWADVTPFDPDCEPYVSINSDCMCSGYALRISNILELIRFDDGVETILGSTNKHKKSDAVWISWVPPEIKVYRRRQYKFLWFKFSTTKLILNRLDSTGV